MFTNNKFPAKEKANTKRNPRIEQSIDRNSTAINGTFNLGDTVYIDGMDTTGKVNQIDLTDGRIDLLIQKTNGIIYIIERINPVLLKKVY